MRTSVWLSIVGLCAVALAAACSDDETNGQTDTGGDAGGDQGGDTGDVTPDASPSLCPGVTIPTGCDVLACPSDDDRAAIQTILIETPADSVICFQDGTYSFDDELTLTTRGITLRGTGDAVVFDFAAQTGGAQAMSVTGDDFTMENITLENMPGDGVLVTGAENVIFRGLTVTWEGGPSVDNGAYAIFPVESNNVLVEDCEVSGAADAGIYIGQSTNAIVRRNTVYQNVAGIELENTVGGEIYDNEVYDNTAGILTFNLPNLPVQGGRQIRIYDNDIHDNNHENFAVEGTTVDGVPAGVGILVWAVDQVEIHDNILTNNESAGVLVISTLTYCQLGECGAVDEDHDGFPESLFLHDNAYTNNAQNPHDVADDLFSGDDPLADIVWDGAVDAEKPNDDGQLDLCIDEAESVTFMNFDLLGGFQNVSTDRTPHNCTHESLQPLDIFPE